jgi:hypothetical protein
VSSALDNADKNTFQATIMGGTKLCSRHLPQDIIYCVGGVSVFFPLFTQFFDAASDIEKCCHTSVVNDKLVAEVIELVATVLDGNVSNQQQMYLLSGLSILGFLLQSATPQLLTTKTLSALKYMFDILRNCSNLSLPPSPLSFSSHACNKMDITYTFLHIQACQKSSSKMLSHKFI